jgi:hypothetical protein
MGDDSLDNDGMRALLSWIPNRIVSRKPAVTPLSLI